MLSYTILAPFIVSLKRRTASTSLFGRAFEADNRYPLILKTL